MKSKNTDNDEHHKEPRKHCGFGRLLTQMVAARVIAEYFTRLLHHI